MRRIVTCCAVALAAACSQPPGNGGELTRVNADNHPYFPIAASLDAGHSIGFATPLDGPVTCESCHPPTAASFKEFSCTNCHTHAVPIDEMLHRSVEDAGTASLACLACHPSGDEVPYDHALIVSGECATCHAEQTAFAALPKPGFTHPAMGTSDCGGCHNTHAWSEVSGAPNDKFDPTRNAHFPVWLPTFSGPTIVSMQTTESDVPMPMFHGTAQIDAGLMANCDACHATADRYPGYFHSTLMDVGEKQPARCNECHSMPGMLTSRPVGFVGDVATNPARTPESGEMRHEAVAWSNGQPGSTPLVTADCATCHFAPNALSADWSATPTGLVQFHASLSDAGMAQPTSCIDCHANTRPTTLLTSQNSSVAAGLTFDHQSADLMGDCQACHASTTTWSGGSFHPAGAQTPSTCLPCHEQKRPTSTSGWMSTGWQNRPFDFVGNDAGANHGAGEDCASCHNGPGSGMWGGTQNWQRGHFPHGASTIAGTTCFTCHVSQRPDNLPGASAIATAIGFDHRLNGTGDCFACHQATVTANRYQNFYNPGTNMLPGGDWAGGTSYPGDFLITSPGHFVALTTYRLTRPTPTGLITGITSQSVTLPNAMKHTSVGVPAQVHPGPAATPNNTTCWHCHTHSADGTVTSYANGLFHSALTSYSANPDGGGAMTLAQPSTNCRDCHAQMLPPDLVQRGANPLFTMDHRARFTAPVNIGGSSVSSVDAIDCSRCHRTSGTAWTDGRFHSNIASATPETCQNCHYPVMATTSADVTTNTRFTMKHRSTVMTSQACSSCHTMALGRAVNMPTAATLWNPGEYHSHVSTQPATCIDCHSITDPTTATQGTVSYTLAMGGSTTNGAQWMNHNATSVTGRDCSFCHAADARASGAAWNKATAFHSKVTTLTQCSICHGTGNGRGTTQGTNNNLPATATDTRTVTTTNLHPGMKAQMNHADVNASGRDCNFCHTQNGPSTTAGITGKEWAQATFHARFTASTPLVTNGTTGRCSNCHVNEKPGTGFATDHSMFTAATSSQDCSTCHSYPGDRARTPMPNWYGAAGVPTFISVGGFTIPVPPATAANTLQQGIANLPHPPVASGVACTTCHTQAGGGRRAFGYPHASTTLIANNCNSCHEAGSDLVGTVWNGATSFSAGAGDTRPFTLTSVVPTFKGNSRSCAYPKHWYPIDCKQCHRLPSGNGNVTTGTAYTTAWKFQHTESKMTRPSTCNTCHNAPCNLPD